MRLETLPERSVSGTLSAGSRVPAFAQNGNWNYTIIADRVP